MSNLVALRRPDGDDPLGEFVEYLYGEGLSPRTISVYTRLLSRAIEFLETDRNTTVDLASAYDVVELAQILPQNRSSLAQLRATLNHYWTMTGRHRPPVKAIRIPRKGEMVSRALTDEQARKLLASAKDQHPEGTAVMLGLYLALRVGEMARARWDRFEGDYTWYKVQNIKGGAVDRLPVHPELRDHLRTVRGAVRVFGEPTDGYVFPGRGSREFVTEATVWGWVNDLAEVAGIGRIHTHRLRHTALTVANDATGDLRAVSKFARHARMETTMGYTRTTTAALERVMESLDYASDEKREEQETEQVAPRWGPARRNN